MEKMQCVLNAAKLFSHSSRCLVWLCCTETEQVEFSTGRAESGGEGVKGEVKTRAERVGRATGRNTKGGK